MEALNYSDLIKAEAAIKALNVELDNGWEAADEIENDAERLAAKAELEVKEERLASMEADVADMKVRWNAQVKALSSMHMESEEKVDKEVDDAAMAVIELLTGEFDEGTTEDFDIDAAISKAVDVAVERGELIDITDKPLTLGDVEAIAPKKVAKAAKEVGLPAEASDFPVGTRVQYESKGKVIKSGNVVKLTRVYAKVALTAGGSQMVAYRFLEKVA